MTGAMQGSTHSLRQIIRTRRARQRLAAAGRVTSRRHSSHAGEIAAIHSDFAHRFHLAKQEVCVSTRSAMMQRLTSEKQAALARVRFESVAEALAARAERKAARGLLCRFRAAVAECGLRQEARPPHRPNKLVVTQLGIHRFRRFDATLAIDP